MSIEKTLIFIKPYIELAKAEEILEYGYAQLKKRGDNPKVIEDFITFQLPLDFFLEFYSQIGERYPEVLQTMASDFSSCPHGLRGHILKGEDIIEKYRLILGPRIIEQNPPWTIRGRYGEYKRDGKGHRTVAHCSTRDEAQKDFMIFKKWNLISKLA